MSDPELQPAPRRRRQAPRPIPRPLRSPAHTPGRQGSPYTDGVTAPDTVPPPVAAPPPVAVPPPAAAVPPADLVPRHDLDPAADDSARRAAASSGRHMVEPPFRVLLVCTANRCRTPIVEHLMRRSTVLAAAGWAVVSAGLKNGDGLPMHPLAAEVLQEQGFDTSAWVTRALTPALVAAADLVLAADRQTRRDIVTMVPQSLNRTFVLGQFARLATAVPQLPDGTPRGRGLSLIGAVRAARPTVSGLHDDDLEDPVGHRIRRFRATVQTVEAGISRIETPYRD